MASRKSYSCTSCGHHVHPTAGTIYHRSRTPLQDWFYAVFQVSTTRTGYSAKQLEREIGVTYKTAWRMLSQIRKMLQQDDNIPLSGEVEVDEAYMGNREGGIRRRGAGTKKAMVLGMVERGGRASLEVMPSNNGENVRQAIRTRINPEDTTLYTDEWAQYRALDWQGYKREAVTHSKNEWARGRVHTNTIEGFWSIIKYGLIGVYRGVSRQHLQGYLDEYTFRYNGRRSDEAMFNQMIRQSRKQVETHPASSA